MLTYPPDSATEFAVNFALSLESAGRLGEAFKAYETALEVAPEDLAAIEGLASLTLRTGRDEPRLRGWLEQIALGATGTPWASWARGRIAQADTK